MVAESVFIFSTFSLVIQLVVLSLLLTGYFLKRMQRYRQHGIIMTTSLILHIITILSVMIPSLLNFSPFILEDPSAAISLATITHAALGSTAALLGIFLVGSWRLQKNIQMCFQRKRFMDLTIVLWIIAILLGIFLYASIVMS